MTSLLRFSRHALGLLALFSAAASAQEPKDISAELEVLRAKYQVPACASAVIERGRITALGATGFRRVDQDVRVTPADIWHIGSCTKSMTAALVGMLVDDGKLRWETTVPEAIPCIACAPGWSKVTVWDVVTQRSGLAPMTRDQWRTLNVGPGTPREQRTAFARQQLAQSPTEPPGKFAYSNSGYGVLGAIIEQAGGASYEDLLHTRIFAPLGLKTAGFGAPATPGRTDQPWGHYRRDDRLVPADPIPENQFPAALAPAGCVHMSLADFARYAWWLSTGEPRLVKAETFARLQTPPEGSSYAGGLWKTVLPGIGGDAVCHTGHIGGLFGVFHAGKERASVSVFNVSGGGWEWFGDEIARIALQAAP